MLLDYAELLKSEELKTWVKQMVTDSTNWDSVRP